MVIDYGLCESVCPLYLCTLPFSFKKETFSREKNIYKANYKENRCDSINIRKQNAWPKRKKKKKGHLKGQRGMFYTD